MSPVLKDGNPFACSPGRIHYLFMPHWCERLRFVLRAALTTTTTTTLLLSSKVFFCLFVSLSIPVHFTTLRSTVPHLLKTYLYVLIENRVFVFLAFVEKKLSKGSIYIFSMRLEEHIGWKIYHHRYTVHDFVVCFNVGMCLVGSIYAHCLISLKIAGSPVRASCFNPTHQNLNVSPGVARSSTLSYSYSFQFVSRTIIDASRLIFPASTLPPMCHKSFFKLQVVVRARCSRSTKTRQFNYR